MSLLLIGFAVIFAANAYASWWEDVGPRSVAWFLVGVAVVLGVAGVFT